jgi:hypothetical protein
MVGERQAVDRGKCCQDMMYGADRIGHESIPFKPITSRI